MPTAVRFNPPGDVPGPPVQFESEDMGDPGAGFGFESDHTYEGDWFFFHTDHLGSTSYLTDTAGNVSQFVCYTPYGEAIVDEHLASYENPFKFSGKELDDITRLYDHGSRSRNPISTLWYGVDPLWEIYTETGPYNYCGGNPIIMTDPDGKGWICNKNSNVYTWNEDINSQEDFEKSKFKDTYTYAGQEFMQAVSMGSTAGMMTEYYHSDGSISYHDYPRWLDIAKSYEGLREGNNPTIQSMIDNMNSDFGLEGINRPIRSDKDPWCGVFAYTCLKEAGLSISKDRSWETPAKHDFYSKNWAEGKTTDSPIVGALAIMNYHHVAFVDHFDDKYVWIIGGNQSANGARVRDGVEVNIKRYPRSIVSAYVVPLNMNLAPLGNFKQ